MVAVRRPEPTSSSSRRGVMTAERLQAIIADCCDESSFQGMDMFCRFGDVPLEVSIDPLNDRVRILAAICRSEELAAKQLARLLVANFASSQDARYCIGHGRVFAAFTHPLTTLNRSFVEAAIDQVVCLHGTYGNYYTSGDMETTSGEDDSL